MRSGQRRAPVQGRGSAETAGKGALVEKMDCSGDADLASAGLSICDFVEAAAVGTFSAVVDDASVSFRWFSSPSSVGASS